MPHCADCGYTYTGITHRKKQGKSLPTVYRGYRCFNRAVLLNRLQTVACQQNYIVARVIEDAVWSVVWNALLDPAVLLRAMETEAFNNRNSQVEQQIAHLERAIEQKVKEDEKLYSTYMADVFDKYRARRKRLKAEVSDINADLNAHYPQRASRERFVSQKALLLGR